MMGTLISVFLGGGLGASLRWALGMASLSFMGKTWPGTLLVNIVGTALLCLILKGRYQLSENAAVFLTTGLMGGLTTFSTFSYEVVHYYLKGQIQEAILIFLLNIGFGIAMGVWVLR